MGSASDPTTGRSLVDRLCTGNRLVRKMMLALYEHKHAGQQDRHHRDNDDRGHIGTSGGHCLRAGIRLPFAVSIAFLPLLASGLSTLMPALASGLVAGTGFGVGLFRLGERGIVCGSESACQRATIRRIAELRFHKQPQTPRRS